MKKLLVLLLAVMCMFSLTACGGEKKESDAVKIGFSGPLTGDYAAYGLGVANAAELAIEEINAKGGLQFELKALDDEGDPTISPTKLSELLDWGLQISLYTVTSGAGAAVAQDLHDENIFALTPSGSATDLVRSNSDDYSTAYGNAFQMCFTDPNQGVASADYIHQKGLSNNVAVIYNNEDVYSNGIYQKFMEEAKKIGLNVVKEEGFGEKEEEFTSKLQNCKEAGADLVFLPIYYTPASKIMTQAKAMEYDVTFFGCDGLDGILTSLDGFDTSLAEGTYMLTPFDANAKDELTQNFVKNYTAKYGKDTLNQFAADAYDCVYAIYAACQNANITKDMKASEICDLLVKEFTTMTFNGLTGTDITWQKHGEVSKFPKAVIITNGEYQSVE